MSSVTCTQTQVPAPSSQAPNLITLSQARLEAERRVRLLRRVSSSVVGYCNGYADGFEHAVIWLQNQDADPLSLEYRLASGMKNVKDYYECHPKERDHLLEWFKKMVKVKS